MKKFYSLILLMCLAIGNAWAGSGLYICGEEVSVSSSWTRNASSFKSDATGTISYIWDTGTLKFNNVKLNLTSDTKVIYNKSQTQLDIIFEGKCELTSKNKIIQYDVWTILEGSASSEVLLWSLNDEEVLFSNNYYNTGTQDPYAKLEINNFPNLLLVSAGDYCISHTYGAVYINNSHIYMEGSKGTIHSNSYALGWFSKVILQDSYYAGNYDYMYTDNSYDVAIKPTATYAEKVKKCTILRDSEYSGVRLDGIAVLATDSRWNASTKTLKLDDKVNGSSFAYPAAITVEKPGITIDGSGNWCQGREYGLNYGNIGSSSAPTTVRNIKFYGNTGIYGVSGYINIGDDVNVFGEDYAVKGGYVTFCPTANKLVNLQRINASTYSNFEKKAVLVKKLILKDCEVQTPQGGVANDTTIVSASNTPWNQQVVIKGWEKYDLYVNGTQVNEKNKDNLTSLLGSNATGTLKYNPSTKTLTMNNLKAAPNADGNLIYSLNGVTLAVEGVNEITAPTQSTRTMYSSKGLVITKGNNTQSKLTLNGNPKTTFIEALQVNIRDVSLYIDGKCQKAGIVNQSDYYFGSISNSSISIKCGTKPLSGRWTTGSPLYGFIPDSDQDITINPSTKELVYCDDYGPTTIPVTDDITIYPMPDYTLTISGNKPQSYTSEDGVCFDEFSRRLYLRNVRGTGIIIANIPKLKIHTIGNCAVWSDDCPLIVTPETLIFQGPGSLSLTSSNGSATQIIRRSATSVNGSTVQVNNTKLKLKGKSGMLYNSSTSLLGTLSVTGSRVEADCEGVALFGFSILDLKNCFLQTPQGGYYSNNVLHNLDGTVAMSLLILPDTPDEIALDAHSDNDSFIFSNYGKEGIVTIKNLTIKGDGSWRTICLPFNVKRIGSVLQNCDIREYSSTLSRQQGDVEILDFTTSVLEMKANVPYIIRNMSGTDIVNPNFGFVKLEGSKQSVYMGISLGGSTSRYFAGSYAQRKETGVHVLEEGSMELSRKSSYTADAFEAIFSFWYKDTDFKVIYTGSSEDDLIDGVSLIPAIAEGEGDWYSLDGSKLPGKPAKPGLYIQNGKKVVVK